MIKGAPIHRPRIIHLIPAEGMGGVEIAARSMAAREDLACDFDLIWIAGPTRAQAYKRNTVSRYRSSLNPFAHLASVLQIIRHDPDVLIASLWRSAFVAAAIRVLRPRVRIVAFLHSESETYLPDRIFSKLLLWAADEVWGDSSKTLASRVRPDGRPRRTISFVTERPQQATSTSQTPRPQFVLWSRIHRVKGIDRAIALIDELVKRKVDARMDVWGPDAGERARLQAQIESRSLQDHVCFRGEVDRQSLSLIASKASFFLQPSRSEGMSMACVEAMQLGLVPVVTAVGEMATYVVHGETGIILDPTDIARCADYIIRVLGDTQHFSSMRQAAIRHWEDAPLYADDVCRAAGEAMSAPVGSDIC